MPCSWQVQGVWLGLHAVTVECNILPVLRDRMFVRMLLHCLCEYL